MKKLVAILLFVSLSLLLVACPPVPDEDAAPNTMGLALSSMLG